MYSEAMPNQQSSTPATPQTNANTKAPLALRSATTPRMSLNSAWPTIMTVVMMPPTTSTSNATSVRDFV